MCIDCSSTNLPSITNTEIIANAVTPLIWRGTFDATIQYSKNNIVFYQGSSYIATSQPTLGVLPTSNPWQVFAQSGSQGNPGQNGTIGGVSFRYQFSTATTATNPGNGFLKADNGLAASATHLYINSADASGGSLAGLFTLANGGHTLIKIFDSVNSDSYAVYLITTSTNNTGWYTFVLTYVTGTVSTNPFFQNNQNITIALGLNPS